MQRHHYFSVAKTVKNKAECEMKKKTTTKNNVFHKTGGWGVGGGDFHIHQPNEFCGKCSTSANTVIRKVFFGLFLH